MFTDWRSRNRDWNRNWNINAKGRRNRRNPFDDPDYLHDTNIMGARADESDRNWEPDTTSRNRHVLNFEHRPDMGSYYHDSNICGSTLHSLAGMLEQYAYNGDINGGLDQLDRCIYAREDDLSRFDPSNAGYRSHQLVINILKNLRNLYNNLFNYTLDELKTVSIKYKGNKFTMYINNRYHYENKNFYNKKSNQYAEREEGFGNNSYREDDHEEDDEDDWYEGEDTYRRRNENVFGRIMNYGDEMEIEPTGTGNPIYAPVNERGDKYKPDPNEMMRFTDNPLYENYILNQEQKYRQEHKLRKEEEEYQRSKRRDYIPDDDYNSGYSNLKRGRSDYNTSSRHSGKDYNYDRNTSSRDSGRDYNYDRNTSSRHSGKDYNYDRNTSSRDSGRDYNYDRNTSSRDSGRDYNYDRNTSSRDSGRDRNYDRNTSSRDLGRDRNYDRNTSSKWSRGGRKNKTKSFKKSTKSYKKSKKSKKLRKTNKKSRRNKH